MAEIPSSNVICRYFLENTCRAGEKCRFMHDVGLGILDDECRFYRVNGKCRYGRGCNYDHVRHLVDGTIEVVSRGKRSLERDIPLQSQGPEKSDSSEPKPTSTALLPLCKEFESSGVCPSVNCPAVHGELCETCEKYIIHPHNRYLNLVHESRCKPREATVPTLKEMLLSESADLMCGICLDTVYGKLGKGSKRFGLLSDCRHVFCWDCIRGWREIGWTAGMKTCPECRTFSKTAVPSVFYVSGGEVKDNLFKQLEEKKLENNTAFMQKELGRLLDDDDYDFSELSIHDSFTAQY